MRRTLYKDAGKVWKINWILGEGAGKGACIQQIRFWHAWLKKFLARWSFIFQYYGRKLVFRLNRRAPRLKKMHLNSFPAINLKKLDTWDFTLKFSNELLILVLALVVAACNIYFFSLQGFADKSFAAKFLNNHPDLNKKLFAKNNSIVTTITRSNGLFPQALAENSASLESVDTVLGYSEEKDPILDEEALVKPNPDSIQALLDKQIKIYETKKGDNLRSIAQANGISEQTVMWANNLPTVEIKPGWFLLILPVNGVLHKATSNDTLPDIAKKYSADINTIISYNMLENEEDIDKDQMIIVPGGKMPSPKVAKPKTTTPAKPGATQPKVYDNGTGHIFPWGYCTYYVATKVHVPWGGNAKNWPDNAKAYGAMVSKEPAAGAIVVTTDNSRYGHVAYVEKVEDGRILISEMNYKGKGILSTRWLSASSRTIRWYIYP